MVPTKQDEVAKRTVFIRWEVIVIKWKDVVAK